MVPVVGTAHRKTYMRRRLYIEEVCALIPAVGVGLDDVLAVVEDEGTVLGEGAEHRRTAWATVQPDHYRVSSHGTRRFHIHVMQ